MKVTIQKWHLEIFELSLEKLNPTKEPTVKVGNTGKAPRYCLLTFILTFDVKADCH